MSYLLRISDIEEKHQIVLTFKEEQLQQPASDFIFDVLGNEYAQSLVDSLVLPAGQLDDYKRIQSLLFDKDAQGLFIREGINLTVNGADLLPDQPIARAFVKAQRDGQEYQRCDLVIDFPGAVPRKSASTDVQLVTSDDLLARTGGSNSSLDGANSASIEQRIEALGLIFFLHQIAVGNSLDVTKDYPELNDLISQCEHKQLIDIDVKKAAYKLTESGQKQHSAYIAEAQDLIKRFDIYSDVDVDQSGVARFDTGLGKDWRVPMFELEGLDPFRCRFILGINDGEWNGLTSWTELVFDQSWYAEIFASIETAPSQEDIGKALLLSVREQAHTQLRNDPQLRSH